MSDHDEAFVRWLLFVIGVGGALVWRAARASQLRVLRSVPGVRGLRRLRGLSYWARGALGAYVGSVVGLMFLACVATAREVLRGS